MAERFVSQTLIEACRCKHFWGLSPSRNGNDLSPAWDDPVAAFEQWRKECPDYHKRSHAAFCERCDVEPFKTSTDYRGYLKKYDGRPQFRSRNLAVTEEQKALVAPGFAAKIKATNVVTSRELNPMTDFNSQEIADILRMANGTSLSARERLHLPSEIMDAMAGDAAQEAMLKDRVLEEMRRQNPGEDPRFVNLDLMEMEKGDVDAFLKKARGRIIKRSKSTRKACCTRIGGVLDQLIGPEGGDWADPKPAKDRGKSDPIGEGRTFWDQKKLRAPNIQGAQDRLKMMTNKFGRDADMLGARITQARELETKGRGPVPPKKAPVIKKGGRRVTASDTEVDLLHFIAEEFSIKEHDKDCDFAAMLWQELSEEQKFIQESIRKVGPVRGFFGESVSYADATDKLNALVEQRRLSESDTKLLNNLHLLLKALAPAQEDKQGELERALGLPGNAGPSHPNSGAGRSIQVSHTESKEAEERGEALRAAGWRARAQAVDNAIKQNKGKKWNAEKQRFEDMDTSNTANALAAFEECRYAAGPQKHTSDRGKTAGGGPAGDLSHSTRPDNQAYPTEPMAAKGAAGKTAGAPMAAKGKGGGRYEKGKDPIGEDEIEEGVRKWTRRAYSSSVSPEESMRAQRRGAAASASGEARAVSGKHHFGRSWRDVDADRESVEAQRERRAAHRARRGQTSDIDYDGPQISETASALADFMEACGPHVSTKHTSYSDPMKNLKSPGQAREEPAKTRPDNKEGYVKTGLLPAKSERKGTPRHQKGGHLPGDAGEVENKDRRGGKKAKPF